jgi:N-acetylglucosaminyldiphosphoundecaprenol N-acetyl-beta-D-mannosaminyltransferase
MAIAILGVRVDDVTQAEAGEQVVQLVARGGAYQLASVNPEFIMQAQTDKAFAEVLARTTLNIPDGVGVLWAAQRLGQPLRERVTGVDLMTHLCALGARHKWRAYFLGARPGIAEVAAARLAAQYPGLIVAGTQAGSPHETDDAMQVAKIRQAAPQLLFVAFGAPAQDMWLARNLPSLTPSPSEKGLGEGAGVVGMGVGGAFDFVAGVQRRAPPWVQRAGLEWLFRLIQQPQRWRRQLALPRFAWLVLLKSFKS